MAQLDSQQLSITNLKVRRKRVLNSEPFIEFSFTLVSRNETGFYALFPGMCEWLVQDRIIANLIVLPQHNQKIGYTPADERETGAFIHTTNIGPISETGVPILQKIDFSSTSAISSEALTILNTLFEVSALQDRLQSNVRIKIPTLIYKEDGIPYGGTIASFNSTYELLRADWLEWIHEWGYRTTLMYLPSDVYNVVRQQMIKAGYMKEWEVVSAAIRSLDKEIPSVKVLRGNDSHQLFRDRLKDIISNAKNSLFIICTTIDTSLVPELDQAYKRGLDIKIVVSTSNKSLLGQPSNAKGLGFNKLLGKVQIRLKEGFHGRMVIADDLLLVGSMDLDNQGLSVHDNLAIQTDDPTALTRSKELFSEIFGESNMIPTSSKHAKI